MSEKRSIGSAALVLFALASAFGAAPEQVQFSMEDEKVQHPIILPDDVQAILRNDSDLQQDLETEHQSTSGPLPPSWFAASVVHLDGPREEDIVVVATGMLLGANMTRFWVFRPTGHRHELILTAVGHDLIVTKKRWRGYRIIETAAMTAVSYQVLSYRFDGGQYRGFKDSGWRDIN